MSLSLWLDAHGGGGRTAEAEIQTDLSLETQLRPRTRSVGTLTAQETAACESDFDRWWRGVLEAAEEEVRGFKLRPALHMSKPQLLGLIAAVRRGGVWS